MSGHTPGPWYVSNGKVNDHWHAGRTIGSEADGTRVCDVTPLKNDARAFADARLIAAAPELLAALKRMERRYVELIESGDCGFWNADTDQDVIDMRAAIAKAEGK